LTESKPDLGNKSQEGLPKLYKPAEIEGKWQEYWGRPDVYEAVYRFDKRAGLPTFVADTPPPFTSGELHIGQAYWVVISDTLGRYKRMRGLNVLLPQGWDCQGLPTELKVQYRWKIPREDKEKFREKCREWTHLMIVAMKGTMIKLGYRPDWEQFEYRTMDPSYWRVVQSSLLGFYERGLIYRQEFPVHWCPRCETALAQAELGYVEEGASLYYIKFPSDTRYLEVATTRPELISACQALTVHPEDERYKSLVGGKVRTPIFDKEISVIADADVDPAFGTGIVMICTFGDEQDIRWQQRYRLPTQRTIDERGRIINTGRYDGLDVKTARARIVEDLRARNLISREERISHKVLSHTERSDCQSPIEFLVRKQWFIRILPLKQSVLAACKTMEWIPPHNLQRLVDWVGSVEWDWVISRQRVYGTPIPFWYCGDCDRVIPAEEERLPVDPSRDKPPLEVCPKCGSGKILGADDVCDCWVDSSITPLIISGYLPRESYFSRAYPSDVRVQGHDIIRTWLFYTTLRCMTLAEEKPFRQVLIHGHILGPDGHRMSKSRGNVIDPGEHLVDHGADSLRQALLSLTIGSDFPFKWEVVKYGKAFLQKYWSSARFAEPFIRGYTPNEQDPKVLTTLDRWILARLYRATRRATEAMEKYRFHAALETIQSFFWHEFCDQYLETVKHRLYREYPDDAAKYTLFTVLRTTTLLLAPICPHITEEIHHVLFKEQAEPSSVHGQSWPDPRLIPHDRRFEQEGRTVIGVIAKIRSLKSRGGLPLSSTVKEVKVKASEKALSILKREEEAVRETLHIQKINYSVGKRLSASLG
jgi:valyl-tRNA synthetase